MSGDVDIQLGVLVEFGEGERVVPVCAGVCVCMYVLVGLVKRLRGLDLSYRAGFRVRARARVRVRVRVGVGAMTCMCCAGSGLDVCGADSDLAPSSHGVVDVPVGTLTPRSSRAWDLGCA